ncbi:hypothetical protein CVT24_003977 [Panaeolus cyanescens]|uniref:Ribonuclease H1 N-terminal domain-containing protein n=1 Tax=Panaeolus cyanescens TaxID=181874 RepID=A0A409Y6J3_9AGAR|nr:hypothetical protein CVT24_003977 [Panaeolus cyanescens]
MPKKWYVVTAGREIGVFSDWLDAAASVRGLDDAIYKGYPTEEEARMAFSKQEMKGNTQIIRDGRRFEPSPNKTKTTTNAPQRLSASLSMPTPFISTPPETPVSSPRARRQEVSSARPTRQSDHLSPAMNGSASGDFLSRSSNGLPSPLQTPEGKEAAKARRLEAIKQCYKEDAMKKSEGCSQSSFRHNATSSMRNSPRSFHTPDSFMSSPRLGDSDTLSNKSKGPQYVVNTPKWIRSYPVTGDFTSSATPELLSPLNLGGVSPLPNASNRTFSSSPMRRQTPLTKCATEPNLLLETANDNSIGRRASSRTSDSLHAQNGNGNVSEVLVDPRSPMMDEKVIRDLQFVRSPLPVASRQTIGIEGTARRQVAATEPSAAWDE